MNYSELTEVKPYPAYKTSQIPWIGEIPEHWEVSHLRYFCECLDGRRIPLSAENRGDKQGNIPYWGANSVIDHINGWIFDEPLVLVGEDGAPFTDTTRSVAFFVNEKVWVNNHIHVLRCSKELRPEFLVHILNSVDYKDFISGSTRDKLTQQRLLDIPIQLAPPTEQAAIVRFLDHADEQIQRYIASKERLIALLEEERQALVHQAVTRGLDPNVRLKPSEVEWLGDVPEHWDVDRLKTHVANINDSTRERKGNEPYIALEHVESWTGKIHDAGDEISFDSQVKRFQAGDVLFGKLRPYLAKVTAPNKGGVCVGEFLVLRTNQSKMASDYLELLMRSKPVIDTINASTFGAKMPRADWDFIGSLEQPIPPISEQVTILEHLDRVTSHIDAATNRARRQVELMGEYRTKLIADVVTGKIDVRRI